MNTLSFVWKHTLEYHEYQVTWILLSSIEDTLSYSGESSDTHVQIFLMHFSGTDSTASLNNVSRELFLPSKLMGKPCTYLRKDNSFVGPLELQCL